ncbi:MAG: hypothetical protein LBD76_06945 [Prevotellaceae bacterium]|jgi:hypothetical protein|nr:hypothetical protein [Prevotellaceae bacterium]
MIKEEVLKPTIVNAFRTAFEHRCVCLLFDAFASVQFSRCFDMTSPEECISTLLFDHVDKSPQAAEWYIGVAPEYRKYKNKVLKDKRVKTDAPKISLKFGSWANATSLDYFIETQSVTEDVFKRKLKSKPVKISELHVQYIAKLDKHLANKSPVQGCVIAYILEGDIKYMANCLNHYLCDSNRVSEILKKSSARLQQFAACYVSTHDNCSTQHLMFDFSGKKRAEEKTTLNVTEN